MTIERVDAELIPAIDRLIAERDKLIERLEEIKAALKVLKSI